MIFVVFADGKEVWSSGNISNAGQKETCDVNAPGVSVLRLEVRTMGPHMGARRVGRTATHEVTAASARDPRASSLNTSRRGSSRVAVILTTRLNTARLSEHGTSLRSASRIRCPL